MLNYYGVRIVPDNIKLINLQDNFIHRNISTKLIRKNIYFGVY